MEDLKERLTTLEERLSDLGDAHNGTDRAVAVLSNQMGGVIRLLWMILGALVVGIVGAFITAWVKVPTVHYDALPRSVEAPR